MSLTRKEFLSSVISVVAGAAGAAVLVGCGSSSSGPDAAAKNCSTNGTAITIEANHGHALTVAKEDVVAGVDKTYAIMGTSAHSHNVTVTAAMFAMLKNNTSVTISSTAGGSDGHTHSVLVDCA